MAIFDFCFQLIVIFIRTLHTKGHLAHTRKDHNPLIHYVSLQDGLDYFLYKLEG